MPLRFEHYELVTDEDGKPVELGRGASGNTAEGIPWIEQGIRDYRATSTVVRLPFYLGLKAEALHLADLLRQ
jgi:hypothetical protein